MCALRVSGAVKRMACRMAPASISSYRTSPGRIGRPAASALVHPLGRSAFEVRSQVAPALDLRRGRDRVGDMVRLVVVLELDGAARRGVVDDVVGDAVAEVLAEV